MNKTVQHLKYEIRTIEAWADGEGWYYNQTWHVDDVEVRGEHVKEDDSKCKGYPMFYVRVR